MVISTGFGWGLFFVNDFGSPGFVGCIRWWLQNIATMVLSEAEFCTGTSKKNKIHDLFNVSLDVSLRCSWIWFSLKKRVKHRTPRIERLDQTQKASLHLYHSSWCYLGQVILWQFDQSTRESPELSTYGPVTDGTLQLIGTLPLNISTILITSPWIRFFLSSLQF